MWRDDAERLTAFVISFWAKNKRVPFLSEMCDAIDYNTSADVGKLLSRMRGGQPLVKRRSKSEKIQQHETFYWLDAWKYRRYLRYRTLPVNRDFITSYLIRNRVRDLIDTSGDVRAGNIAICGD